MSICNPHPVKRCDAAARQVFGRQNVARGRKSVDTTVRLKLKAIKLHWSIGLIENH